MQEAKKFLSKKRRTSSDNLPFSEKTFLIIAIKALYFDVWQRKKDTLYGHIPYFELDNIPQTAYLTYGTNYTDDDLTFKIQNKNSGTIAFEHLLNFIIKQLNEFTKCFELYLSNFVNNLDIPTIKFIDNILKTPNLNIISFNYTNTISKYIAISNDNISFIHDKAVDNEHNNLVLGIDDRDNQADPQFMRFKKYFQRYEKDCNTQYCKWIKDVNHLNAISSPLLITFLLLVIHSLLATEKSYMNL